MGDFNSQIEEEPMTDFCETYNLQNLVKEPTCYKNVHNPTLIDLILTSRVNSFQDTFCCQTGISDYHKMTITVLKTYFQKLKPKKIKYRSYKNFELNSFKNELKHSLNMSKQIHIIYDDFKEIFMEILDKHSPLKEKTVRGNNTPFMNKTLSKAFMLRAKLKNRCNLYPTEINILNYKKQKNYCVNLVNKTKKLYYSNLDITILNDNKKFWKNIRPLFSDKKKDYKKDIILIEKDKVTSNEKDVAEIINNYFVDVIENLDIEPYIKENCLTKPSNKNVESIINKYKNHPSILKIKEFVNITDKFTFKKTTKQVAIPNLNIKFQENNSGK